MDNELTELPSWISRCRKLVGLSVDRNLIGRLPASINELDHLEIFTCSKNKLEALPSLTNWRLLKQIDLRNNQLPKEIQKSTVNDRKKTQALLELMERVAPRSSSAPPEEMEKKLEDLRLSKPLPTKSASPPPAINRRTSVWDGHSLNSVNDVQAYFK
jgi:hypothetical protein